MDVEVKLRLTRPWLGDMPRDERGVRKLSRVRGLAKIHYGFWKKQFKAAIRALDKPKKYLDAIDFPDGVPCASTHLYKRVWSRVNVEMFECFQTGTVLTLKVSVREDVAHPSVDEVKELFEYIGMELGLSQFGSKFNYGRFTVDTAREI